MKTNPAIDHTWPDSRGECGFCHKEEGGYAKQDERGVWQAACWNCIKPEPLPPQKRKLVGTVFTEDLDTEEQLRKKEKAAKKAPGIPPSEYRPKVN